MTSKLLDIAVVGHTNTGKTSLLRTLTRDFTFGEVSDRPAVTRAVSGTKLMVDGRAVAELFDTPGLEDSIGLLELLDSIDQGRRRDGVELIERFLERPEASGTFHQEARAVGQVLRSDIALYVIDARDKVMAKHRDELAILGMCARPILPVLNFTLSPEEKTDAWRAHLARVNMHAVAEFDTVVFDHVEERRLFEKIAILLDQSRGTVEALIDDRERERERLIQAAAGVVADMLIDTAGFVRLVPSDEKERQDAAREAMREVVREREQRCVDQLLELFRFRAEDWQTVALPIDDGRWGMDLFSPDAIKELGMKAGGGFAAGALAGLAVDAMVGGITMGAAAITGGAIGAVLGGGKMHVRNAMNLVRGLTELRVDEPTLRLLAARQTLLIAALLRRGHASLDKITFDGGSTAIGPSTFGPALPAPLAKARTRPRWSRLVDLGETPLPDPDRQVRQDEIAQLIVLALPA